MLHMTDMIILSSEKSELIFFAIFDKRGQKVQCSVYNKRQYICLSFYILYLKQQFIVLFQIIFDCQIIRGANSVLKCYVFQFDMLFDSYCKGSS